MATTMISPSPSSSDPSSVLPSLLMMGSPIALSRPFSPCSLEAIPSFDWSDFPAVGSSSVDENDSEVAYLSSHIYQPQHVVALSSASEAIHQAFFFAEPSSTPIGEPVYASPLKERNLSPSSDVSSLESSPVASSANSRKKARRSVGFQTLVEVRTYAVTLGDHPYCPGGLALTCDWAVQHEARVSMETLEQRHRRQPRRASELRLSYAQRRHRLVECTGLSPGELLQLEYEQDFFTRRQADLPLRHSAPAADTDCDAPLRQMHVVYHHRSRPLHHTQHSSALLNMLA